jgi:hypothetical protein
MLEVKKMSDAAIMVLGNASMKAEEEIVNRDDDLQAAIEADAQAKEDGGVGDGSDRKLMRAITGLGNMENQLDTAIERMANANERVIEEAAK